MFHMRSRRSSGVAQCLEKKRVARDKTVKQESNGKSSLKSVKFRVSKAVKHDGDTAGTERMTAKLNGDTTSVFD